MKPAIRVQGLAKRYQLQRSTQGNGYRTLRETLAEMALAPIRRWRNGGEQRRTETFWALRDVSLEIEPGEVVGVIGRNGAGKSTLLKILSRITKPSRGEVTLRGRIGSLLEVGTGFHPELTGRENIYLNGALLGMHRREIARKFDDIVSFAEVDQFLDTPVKRYSSGMYVRLAFAVAAHLSTDVLFVDEVLAVGDAAFQKKCLGAMRDLGDGGRTVVFVSHNMATVESLCKRTIWLAGGQVKHDGDTREVINAYQNSFDATDKQTLDLASVGERTGTGAARFVKMEFLSKGGAKSIIRSGDSLGIRLHYECFRDIANLDFGLRIYSNLGVLLSDIHTWTTNQAIPLARKGRGSIDLEIAFLNLMPGTYYLGVWVAILGEYYDVLDNVAQINIEPSDYYGTGRGVEARFGLIFLPFRWTQSGSPEGSEGERDAPNLEPNAQFHCTTTGRKTLDCAAQET